MKVYSDVVRSELRELSDEVFQARVWTGRSPTEMSSFDECVERLFGDSGLQLALNQDAPVFGQKIDTQLRRLDSMVATIDSSLSAEEILANVRLPEIRTLAAEILGQLDSQDIES